MLDRIKWQCIRRRRLIKIVPGFWAGPLTYVDKVSSFEGYNKLYRDTTIGNSKIGMFTYVAGARIGHSTIGRYCSIGPDSLVGGLGRHPTRFLSTHPAFYSSRKQAGVSYVDDNGFNELEATHVGNDVWIGARAVILDGLYIGNGAIIAAGSVVTTNVPAYAIFGGVPAKLIRFRFTEDVIEALEQWQWWQLHPSTIQVIAKKFCSKVEWRIEDIQELINTTLTM